MAFEESKLDAIYEKTDGECHLCRKKLARKNYGKVGSRGAWEVEHSNPRSKGGTDHLNNLLASCVSCNRSKGNSSTRAARSRNGYKSAPYSAEQKTQNTWIGAGVGSWLGWLLVPPHLRIPAAIIGAALGGRIGKNSKPE